MSRFLLDSRLFTRCTPHQVRPRTDQLIYWAQELQ